MAKVNAPLVAFNRGEVSRLALARVDLDRMRLSAEEQINFLPRTLGPMMIRPGLAMKAETKGSNPVEVLPFVFSSSEKAAIELSDGFVRVLVDDAPVSRPDVATTINGDFATTSGWALATSGSAIATIAGGTLNLTCPALGGRATATYAVSVASGDIAKEHGLRIAIARGPVGFRVGSTSGGEELLARTDLRTGVHSLTVTPGATTFYIQFESTATPLRMVDSISIEPLGIVSLPAPWTTADLSLIRATQSGDVLFLACPKKQQRRIERRSQRSWSVVLYETNDGPFQPVASADSLSITPSATTGNITLTASRALFKAGHVGSLMRIFSTSQAISALLANDDVYSDAIRIFGVGTARRFTIDISDTWAGTLTLQRSLTSESAGFVDLSPGVTFTANTVTSYQDVFDNQEAWYRIGFKASGHTSGIATVKLSYPGGGGAGIVRITEATTSTVAQAEVIKSLKSKVATNDWQEGEWSDIYGWPSAVALHDGRLWWAGADKEWASVSDAYNSFDIDFAGDAGPISRTIGYGPIETINWFLPLARLIVGTSAAEVSIRSSSLDEPLTPTNFSQRDCSTQGSAAVAAVKMDRRGIFLQRSKQHIYELAYSVDAQDFEAKDLTQLKPDVAGRSGSLLHLAIQRQPDTRIHAVRSDGTVAVLVYEPAEEVVCWYRNVSDGAGGFIENVYVLPGDIEDQVYYIVRRTIGGVTKRFHERFAREDQCSGFPEARLADSHIMYSGVPTTTITGLNHLEGQSVVVWGWNTTTPFLNPEGGEAIGRDLGRFTVTGGQIVGLPSAVTNACVGLPYRARFKSAKLAYGAMMGTALSQKKKLNYLALVLADTHAQGIRYGQRYDDLDELPLMEKGGIVGDHQIWTEFDESAFELPGEWSSDSRLCLEANAPRPVTILGAVPSISTHEK